MTIPDYIQDILDTQDSYVKYHFERLLNGEVKMQSLTQKRYREKTTKKGCTNRERVIKLGIILQLYRDYLLLEKGEDTPCD